MISTCFALLLLRGQADGELICCADFCRMCLHRVFSGLSNKSVTHMTDTIGKESQEACLKFRMQKKVETTAVSWTRQRAIAQAVI